MAIIGFPYNSQDRDRAINAETYRRLLSKYFTTGVFPNPSTQFQVYATTGMNLTVKAGSANINGVYVEMESDDSITIDTASSQPRIDRVVLKHDDSTEIRATSLVVKKGTPSSNPQAPTLERTETIYEIALADVYVGASATSIAQSDITDLRLDSRLCGIVSATITSIDTTTFFEQMNDDFNTWFDGVKGTLGEDSAGNLLNLINEVKANYIPKSDIVNNLTSGGINKPLSAEQGKILSNKFLNIKKVYANSEVVSLQNNNDYYSFLAYKDVATRLNVSESEISNENVFVYALNGDSTSNRVRISSTEADPGLKSFKLGFNQNNPIDTGGLRVNYLIVLYEKGR